MSSHKEGITHSSVTGRAFRSNAQLVSHKQVHTDGKPFVCDVVCGKTFARKLGLIIHMCVHTVEKHHRCDQYVKSYTQQLSLNCTNIKTWGRDLTVASYARKALWPKLYLICIRPWCVCVKVFSSNSYLLRQWQDTHTRLHKCGSMFPLRTTIMKFVAKYTYLM